MKNLELAGQGISQRSKEEQVMNEDMKYIAADGTVLTDELVEELAAEAENGFVNSVLTPVDGRPWEGTPV